MLAPFRKVSTVQFLLIFITVVAACSAFSTSPLTEANPPTATVTTTLTSPTDQDLLATLNAYLTDNDLSGSVLVARDGKVLLSDGYGEADREMKILNTDQTKYRIASLTKQFTAMAILVLQAQGKLDVQDSVCEYISPCPPAWQDITLHNLLTHTSGLPDYYSSPGWVTYQATPMAPSEIVEHFIDLPMDFQPGKQWKYSNSGYTLLGATIEQVSGMTYEAFLVENILLPLNMQNTGYLTNPEGLSVGYADPNTTRPDSIEDASGLYASGGLYSTVRDLYLWDQALFTDKLIPIELSDKVFTPYKSIPGSDGFGYGYGWFIGRISHHRVVGHSGRIEGYTSINTYYPDDRVAIIILSNQQSENVFDIGVQLAKLVFADE